MTTETEHAGKNLTWDGDMAKFDEYEEKAEYLVLETKPEDRKYLGPRLARQLTSKASLIVRSLDKGELIKDDGVSRLLKHLKEKQEDNPMQDIATDLDNYFNRLKRKRGEDISTFINRSEDLHTRLIKRIKKVPDGAEVNQILPACIMGWHLLSRTSLGPSEQAQVVSGAGGSYSQASVVKALKQQWPSGKLAERDREAPAKCFMMESEHGEGNYYEEGHPATELPMTDISEHINFEVALWEVQDNDELDMDITDINWAKQQLKQGARTFKEARDLLRQAKTSRNFYRIGPRGPPKVGGPEDARRRTQPPQPSGSQNGSSSHAPGRFRGNCLKCGKPGHMAAECRSNPANAAKTHFEADVAEFFIAMVTDEHETNMVGEIFSTVPENILPGEVMLDCGASKSVASIQTLEKIQTMVMEQFKEDVFIVEPDPTQSFRFGNGETLPAASRITMPALIGNIPGLLTIHSIDSPAVPPLLGIDAMSKIGLEVNFQTDQVYINRQGRRTPIPTRRLPSGHLAINIVGDYNQLQREMVLSLLQKRRPG